MSSDAMAKDFIALCAPEIRGNEWNYVKDCLDSGWVSSVGGYVDRFEDEMAAYVGTKYGVSTVNGTSALHVALLVAGVGPEDEVLMPTMTFIAPANAVRYARAWPVFVDVEPDYWQMDINCLDHFLHNKCDWGNGVLRNRTSGRRVKAILPVHILGHPVDMDPLVALAAEFDLAVIEDATESLGATYKGRCTGSLGHIACFSFNGNKIITTGGGGMITTDNASWAKRAKHLTTQAKSDPLEYQHDEIGYNYRLTNIQAAMGCAQMENLPAYVKAKRELAERYSAALSGVPGLFPMRAAAWADPTFWMFTMRVKPDQYGCNSRQLIALLAEEKIQTRPLWEPVHLSVAHRSESAGSCPVAERFWNEAVSLPCSVGLSRADQGRVIDRICKIALRKEA